MIMLYIVSTPIGNLKDITFRAIECLKEVDLIAAEDTRRTGILLKAYSVKTKMMSYNDHNKTRRVPYLIGLIKEGTKIALVSDSGTPGISDPGYNLINAAIDNNIDVVPLPGPSAFISALVASGMPTDKFTFHGFLPKKDKKKKELIISASGTAIFYESPHRIHKTLEQLNNWCPESRICIARELTKVFEQFIRGTPQEVIEVLEDKKIKGEIVLIMDRGKPSQC